MINISRIEFRLIFLKATFKFQCLCYLLNQNSCYQVTHFIYLDLCNTFTHQDSAKKKVGSSLCAQYTPQGHQNSGRLLHRTRKQVFS